MAKQDFYTLLEVSRDVGAEDLKKAYRKLAMKFHPDRNPGDAQAEAQFKAINEAYDVLKDDQKRAAYDRFGHAAFEQGGGGPGGFQGGFGFGTGSGGLDDLFGMFGDMMGGGRNRGPRAGADIRQAVEIDLTEAFAGVKATLRVPTRVQCDACTGTGSEDKARGSDACAACGGTGKLRAQQGFFLVERTCPTCGGQGRVIRNPCRVCQGAGTVQRERNLQVAIPAGVEDGMRIRLAGEGEAGAAGAPAGDLYVHVGVRPHPIFQRAESNILVRVPVRITQAALGGEIEVPVVDGTRTKVKIPPGSQTGDQFRLRGKGFSVLRSAARGDMFIQIAVETPQNLTKKQRELLEAFEADITGHQKSHPEGEGFFTRVKEFFEGRAQGRGDG